MREILIGPHDVEVEVGSDTENLENLVQHVPVLTRNADERLELGGR
jgi:hypothetical protein